jgi:hypothetical protein
MNRSEAKVIAMGIFIEQCVRDGRLDLIPPGEFIPPWWMVEADPNPNCRECGGTGVVEVQSSGDHHTGFDREWDDCDCKYLADPPGRSEDTP